MIIVMKRQRILLFLVVLLVVSGSTRFLNNHIHTSTMPAGNIIIVDPGHGGRDPGTLGHLGKNEKDINLEISQKLKKVLENSGYNVIMTRDTDISLHDEGAKKKKMSDANNRIKIIEGSGAKMLISIHLNEFPESKYYGAQVFYPSNDTTSKKLAEMIQSELKTMVDNSNDRKAKPISTVMLIKNLSIPAVIVECGFISNSNEERLLNTIEYQEKISQAIVSGVKKFIQQSEVSIN